MKIKLEKKPHTKPSDFLLNMQNNKTHSEKSSNNSKLSRPDNLYFNKHFSCDENVNIALKSSSSEEDSSPTELNQCRKVIDKPTLVSI